MITLLGCAYGLGALFSAFVFIPEGIQSARHTAWQEGLQSVPWYGWLILIVAYCLFITLWPITWALRWAFSGKYQ
jgi:4-amino-4-deoxy-L-arabinose transferase-like glycosyltransferase